MSNTYNVIHDKKDLIEEDIINYLKICKEKNYDHLYIELRHDDKLLDCYTIQWPDSKEIVNNEYNNIRITIECSHNKFYCKNEDEDENKDNDEL